MRSCARPARRISARSRRRRRRSWRGYLFDDPIPEATSFAIANGGVEGIVRAAALALGRHTRINAVSPGLAQDSYEPFGQFNPGRSPVPMRTIASAFQRSVEGWRTGEIIRAW